MRRLRKSVFRAVLVVIISVQMLGRADAITVIDPSNLSQNILQVLHQVQSNINEATQIANQIKSLENEIRNLTLLEFSTIEEFRSQLQSLFATLGSIDGLMQHLSDLETRFEEVYPDFGKKGSLVPGKTISEDMYERLKRTRDMIRGSLKTSADVLDKLPASEVQLSTLMEDSQAAVGILQAAQAGNQISGTIAAQLMSLNAQLGSYIQAHTALIMEHNGAAGAIKNRVDRMLDDWGVPYTSTPVEENPF